MPDNNDVKTPSLDALRSSASMKDIAEVRRADIQTPEAAIEALKDGNARFFSGKQRHTEIAANDRRAQIMGQTPYAAVLACSDSRVPVEIVFDQGFGQLFVVRVAGNVVDESGLGTLEYAVRYLDIHLVLVLGHEGCGAVTTALLPESILEKEPPNLKKVIYKIRPSLEGLASISDKKARLREAVIQNVNYQISNLRKNTTLKEAEEQARLKIIGGFYEISSGAVDFLDEAR